MNQQLKHRDRFIELYNSHYTAVFSAVYFRTGSFHDSEDISQEVFLRLYGKIDEVENPRAWIFGTMKNTVLEHYKRKHAADADIDALFNDIGLAFVNGFRETRIMIKEALEEISKQIPEEDISLFELNAVYGFTLAEAARQTGLTYRQARNRYERVCGRLMDSLRQKGINRIEDLL